MMNLDSTHPDIYKEFKKGKFTVQKSNRKFSRIGMDHNHEQQNAKIKGVGGAIGLTENESALQRWLICGPEISRLIDEFEDTDDIEHNDVLEHHDVNLVMTEIDELGNLFMDNSLDMYNIDTKEMVDKKVMETLNTIEETGKNQFFEYFKTRISERSISITNTISKNKFFLFSAPKSKDSTKKDDQLKAAKNNVALFSRLFIACQSREGDLEQFFSHENQAVPPSLSETGDLRPVKAKSGIIPCILEARHQEVNESPLVDCKILDGPAIVNMLDPVKCKKFQDYSRNIFVPYIENQLKNVKRLDIVWDRYFLIVSRQAHAIREEQVSEGR